MKAELNEITINGVEYVAKSSIEENATAEKLDGMPYIIARTYSAGVFAGYLKSKDKENTVLVNARRLWYWDGAASLSQLAEEGVKKPENCKFPCEVKEVELTNTVERLIVTAAAKKSIESVKIWKM